MSIQDSVRKSRKQSGLTQEQMAEKLDLSLTAYANLERGQTAMNLERLQQISEILDVDVMELIGNGLNKSVVLLGSSVDCVGHAMIHYGNEDAEQLKEIIKLKDEIINRQQNEINLLNQLLNQK